MESWRGASVPPLGVALSGSLWSLFGGVVGLPGSFMGAPKAPDRCHCFLKTSWVCAFFVWLDVGAIGVVGLVVVVAVVVAGLGLCLFLWLDVGAIGVVVLVVVVAVVVAGLGLCLFCVARWWGNRSGASRGRGGRGGRPVRFVPFFVARCWCDRGGGSRGRGGRGGRRVGFVPFLCGQMLGQSEWCFSWSWWPWWSPGGGFGWDA